MSIKEIDQLISSLFTTALFFIFVCFYFVFFDGEILNFKNTIIFTYIVIPVFFFIYWIIGKLKLNILDDLCKIF